MSVSEGLLPPEDRFQDVVAGACTRLFGAGTSDLCDVCGHDAAMHPHSGMTRHRTNCTHCVLEAYLRETRLARDDMLVMIDEVRFALTKFYEFTGAMTRPSEPPAGLPPLLGALLGDGLQVPPESPLTGKP